MIRFTLVCDHEHEFEAWFRDNAGFEEQRERGVLSCPVCGDGAVRKALMAPAIARGLREPEAPARPGSPQAPADPRRAALEQMFRALRELRSHVEENFEHVGERFPEEARKIHYGEADQRGIMGKATVEQAREMLEEGIDIAPLPVIPDDLN